MTHSTLTQVLSMPELLVQILGHLDVRNLLLAQRVCRTWASQIQRSASLQQALFLAPAKPTDESPVCNPLLREEFPSFFPDDNQGSSYLRVPGDCFPPLDMPAGRSFPPDASPPAAPSRHPLVDDAARAGVFYGPLGPMRSSLRRDIWLRPEASWRRMFTQQPPLPHLTVMRFWTNSYDRTYAQWQIPGTVKGIADLERYVRAFDWPPSESIQKEYQVPAGVCMGLLFDYLSCDLNLSRWMLMWGPKAPISLAYEWGDGFVEVYERAAADSGLVIMTDEVIWSRGYDDLPWTSNVTNPRNKIVAEYQQRGLVRKREPSYIMRVKPVKRGQFDYPLPLEWIEPEVPEAVQPTLHPSHSSDDLLLIAGH